MSFEEKNHYGNTIQLCGDVDDEMYLGFMRHISKIKPYQSVTIDLNSDGGSWYYGIGIYDRLMLHPGEVTIRVWGHAMSMGSVILQAADRRLMAPSALLMIHDVIDSIDGSVREIETEVQSLNTIRKLMYNIYASRGKETKIDFWRRKCSKNSYFSAEQALELGLIDEIIDHI